jgi:hypothetical protein
VRWWGTVLVWLMAAGVLEAIEIEPASPAPIHRLVRVRYAAGAEVFVLAVRDGELVDVDLYDAGTGLLVFTGPPGSYAILGKEHNQRFQKVIKISGPSPPGPEPPGPEPPGPEPPTPPPDRYGLAGRIRNAVRQAGPTAIKESERVFRAHQQAASAIESRLAAGVRTELAECFPVLSAELRSVKPTRSIWEPIFNQTENTLQKFYKDGTLRTASDWVQATKELAYGIRTARQRGT